jgi:hypothetical protein
VIEPNTRRLLGELFEYRELGPLSLKGIVEPVQACEVLRPSEVESRFEALHGMALTPLVGRGDDLELLLRRWQRGKSGAGQAVLLSGEPGIGKSHLVAALEESIRDEPHIRLRHYCSPYHTDSALHPIIAQLERAAGFERDDNVEIRLDKLEALIAPTSPPREDLTLLAELLLLAPRSSYPRLDLSPQRRKERTVNGCRPVPGRPDSHSDGPFGRLVPQGVWCGLTRTPIDQPCLSSDLSAAREHLAVRFCLADACDPRRA